MKNLRGKASFDDFLAEYGYLDPATEAARARAIVWQLAQGISLAGLSETGTIKGLSQILARSATLALGMAEEELVRLLKNHSAH
ncbi:MAG TPA: hypothetical protein VGC69_17095 [Bordetella sp.]